MVSHSIRARVGTFSLERRPRWSFLAYIHKDPHVLGLNRTLSCLFSCTMAPCVASYVPQTTKGLLIYDASFVYQCDMFTLKWKNFFLERVKLPKYKLQHLERSSWIPLECFWWKCRRIFEIELAIPRSRSRILRMPRMVAVVGKCKGGGMSIEGLWSVYMFNP